MSTWSSGRSRIFLRGAPNPKLAKNCMKMKEFGARGGVRRWRPLGSANVDGYAIGASGWRWVVPFSLQLEPYFFA